MADQKYMFVGLGPLDQVRWDFDGRTHRPWRYLNKGQSPFVTACDLTLPREVWFERSTRPVTCLLCLGAEDGGV